MNKKEVSTGDIVLVLGLCFMAFLWSGIFLFIAIVYVVYLYVTVFKKTTHEKIKTDTLRIYPENSYKSVLLQNSEKHSCKCYMESFHNPFEKKIAYFLSLHLPYKEYFIFNNIIIPSRKNISTQLDHLVVSRYGIFVIDSKDLSGWIFGNEHDEKWTQSFSNGKKFMFQNPLRQNYAHKMALQELMPFAIGKIHDIVVFSDKSEFKKAKIENVLVQHELIPQILSYQNQVFTQEQMQLAIGKLSFACQTLDISHTDHLQNLKINKEN